MKCLFVLFLSLFLVGCGTSSQATGVSSPTVETDGISVSSFKATVSGAVSGDFSGTGSTFKQSAGGQLITLLGTQGISGADISIILPTGTTAGTYPLKSYTDAFDSTSNKITAIGASFSALNKTNGVDIYAAIADGTLTLQSVDPMTGSIHFKAKLDSGGEVEVSAIFYQLLAA
jgi:hypothetical protein